MSQATMRCAIYTRVSSDQGLEQDFNSLHAQREAAEAYIKSQAHEGWKLIREHFDDGGFSGGTMERPALQHLLDQVRERRIDIIVVYKVDRLTRSLADFAKLVELFDAHKVSFVSVTQSFNTTTSMGRLTLNVLLSFAQFEREVTGERIRDKIAASKRKGLWMGGVIPFGYRLEDRKLLVDETEVETVTLIFDLYLKLGSLPAVQRELSTRSIVSRQRQLTTGRVLGGIPFSNGALSTILRNRHYLGELNHRGKSWPGDHAAIIDQTIFDRVQDKLANQRQRKAEKNLASGFLLKGKIFNDAGERMTPNYVVKADGVRHRYYVSQSVLQGQKNGPSGIRRLPAEAVETCVLKAIATEASKTRHRAPGAGNGTSGPAAADDASPEEASLDHDQARPDAAVSKLERVTIRPTMIEIALKQDRDGEGKIHRLSVAWVKPDPIRRKEILEPVEPVSNLKPIKAADQTRLVKAIATAQGWLEELCSGEVTDTAEIAMREHRSARSVRMTLSLAFLDPALITAACKGSLPRGYCASRLMDLPARFDQQWQALGLRRPN